MQLWDERLQFKSQPWSLTERVVRTREQSQSIPEQSRRLHGGVSGPGASFRTLRAVVVPEIRDLPADLPVAQQLQRPPVVRGRLLGREAERALRYRRCSMERSEGDRPGGLRPIRVALLCPRLSTQLAKCQECLCVPVCL